MKYVRTVRRIPHSINYEETGTSEGLWDRLGRRKMTNMSLIFFMFSKSVALLCEAELTRAKFHEGLGTGQIDQLWTRLSHDFAQLFSSSLLTSFYKNN